MKLDLTKSRIIVKKSNLHMNAVHVDCETWGWTDKMKPEEPSRLLNFYRRNENEFGVAPNGSTNLLEIISVEEFSKQIWQVQIQDDWEPLNDIQETKLYAEIIRSGRMFFTLRFDIPNPKG